MWKKIAVPNFGSVMAWVSGLGKQWWFTPLIVVVMFTVFVLWVLSFQTKPLEAPAAAENITERPPTANTLTPPAETQVPSPTLSVATAVAQTVEAVTEEATPTSTLSIEYTVDTAVAMTLTAVTRAQEQTATVAPPTAVQPVATAVPPTAVPAPPTAAPSTAVPPTAVPPTAVPPTAAPPTTASYPPTCIGKFEGPNAFEQAKQKCPGVNNFRVLWTSPRDWHGCVFNSDKVPSDFGSQVVLQGQKLVIWVPRLDETLTDKPDCHSRVDQPSSGGSVPVNSTAECRGMFEGNEALNIAKSACGDKEFKVRWTNPRDPLGCMFNSNQVPKDFNSQEVMQGQKLVFWIPLDSEDLSSIPTCPNLP